MVSKKNTLGKGDIVRIKIKSDESDGKDGGLTTPVSYTHLRAHETVLDLVCRLLLEKKKTHTSTQTSTIP